MDIWTPYRKSAADVAKAACEKGASPIREMKINQDIFGTIIQEIKRERTNSHIFYGSARG